MPPKTNKPRSARTEARASHAPAKPREASRPTRDLRSNEKTNAKASAERARPEQHKKPKRENPDARASRREPAMSPRSGTKASTERARPEKNHKTEERIAKAMAAAGVCSRRDAEKLIAQGAVLLNGAPVTTPATLVGPNDSITVYGERVKRERAAKPRLFLYHKPPGLITTHRDTHGRDTVFEHLPEHLPRVISIGRLDTNSEGLLLLTTSGEIARRMESPKTALPRVYRVRASGRLGPDALRAIRSGITVEGVRYAPIAITEEGEKTGRNQWYVLELSEGKNREIRRIFSHYDLQVSRLIRVAYGPYELGKLERGAVKEVPLLPELYF